MKWIKPPLREPSRDYFIQSECGLFRICKSYTNGVPVYTLSHRGVLVMSGGLAECKTRAEKGND